jgi:predicted metal-dependent peptidase
VRDAVAFARGRVDWSHRRPHRRQGVMSERNGGFGPILPSLVAPVPNIGIVVDTSGSMSAMTRDSRTHLDEALSEVSSIVLSVGVPVWCAAVDAQVQGWVRVKAKSDVSKLIAGGGGTDMCVGIKAAEEKKFDIIVLVTDGYTNWPTPETMPRNSRLVVCCTTDASVPTHIRHVVRIDAEGKKGIRA